MTTTMIDQNYGPDVVSGMPRNGERYQVISYERVSIQEVETGSYTFDTQDQRIKEVLDKKFGADNYDLLRFKDDGVSGGAGLRPSAREKRTRPKLRKIVNHLETRNYDAFIVYNLSRLSRDSKTFLDFLEEGIYSTGTQFISATEDLDLTSPMGRAMATNMAAMAGYQREEIIKRNRDAAATRVEKGYYLGQVGYGWEWEPESEMEPRARRRIVPNLDEKQWIIHMKDRYLSGWNGAKIAGELNNLGIPPASSNPRWHRTAQSNPDARWTAGEVCRILQTPVHAGLLDSRRKGLIQGVHFEHRFWDPEVHHQIKTLCAQRTERFKTISNKTAVHLLNGLVFCDCCDKRLYISSVHSTTKDYRSYRCNRGRPQGKPTCAHITARAQWIEDAVVRELQLMAEHPDMRALLLEEAATSILMQQDQDYEKECLRLKSEIKAKKEQRRKRADHFLDSGMEKEQFIECDRRLKEELSTMCAALTEIEERLENRQRRESWVRNVQTTVLDFPIVWSHLDLDQQRQVLSLLLQKLTVNRQGRDLILKIKIHLLPEKEIKILYRTTRGTAATQASPLQRLTKSQLVVLYYVGQGMTNSEILQAMEVRSKQLHPWSYPIRKKLGVETLQEAYELAKERIEANLDQLPIKRNDKDLEVSAPLIPFISGVLMDVFPLLALDMKVTEIAEKLGLSACTVQARKKRILKAFDTKSIIVAANYAREHGILAA